MPQYSQRLLSRALLALAVLALLGVGAAADARDYFVSSSTSSDSNDGLTPATALQTIAKFNGLALVAGDVVRLRCGDVWRAEILRSSGRVRPGARSPTPPIPAPPAAIVHRSPARNPSRTGRSPPARSGWPP